MGSEYISMTSIPEMYSDPINLTPNGNPDAL